MLGGGLDVAAVLLKLLAKAPEEVGEEGEDLDLGSHEVDPKVRAVIEGGVGGAGGGGVGGVDWFDGEALGSLGMGGFGDHSGGLSFHLVLLDSGSLAVGGGVGERGGGGDRVLGGGG